MAKDIIVCLDGTWNKPELDLPGRGDFSTNVYLTWKAFGGPDLTGQAETLEHTAQVGSSRLIYVRGIGTRGPRWLELLGAAVGLGLTPRILSAYSRLQAEYEPGDRLFVFGFSRGAFAARSLVGMLHCCGLSREDDWMVYGRYAARSWDNAKSVPVQYLGIWDTVRAIPLPEEVMDYHRLSTPNVRHVRHALALDEMREQFRPQPWGAVDPKTNVREVWFAGAHANIGGGYEDQGLSSIALIWVLAGAIAAGLQLNLSTLGAWAAENVRRTPVPSYDEFWRKTGVLGELITQRKWAYTPRTIVGGQRIHRSVADALDNSTYTPKALIDGHTAITSEIVDARAEEWGLDDFEMIEQVARPDQTTRPRRDRSA